MCDVVTCHWVRCAANLPLLLNRAFQTDARHQSISVCVAVQICVRF